MHRRCGKGGMYGMVSMVWYGMPAPGRCDGFGVGGIISGDRVGPLDDVRGLVPEPPGHELGEGDHVGSVGAVEGLSHALVVGLHAQVLQQLGEEVHGQLVPVPAELREGLVEVHATVALVLAPVADPHPVVAQTLQSRRVLRTLKHRPKQQPTSHRAKG